MRFPCHPFKLEVLFHFREEGRGKCGAYIIRKLFYQTSGPTRSEGNPAIANHSAAGFFGGA